jgi:hypothetical protein
MLFDMNVVRVVVERTSGSGNLFVVETTWKGMAGGRPDSFITTTSWVFSRDGQQPVVYRFGTTIHID